MTKYEIMQRLLQPSCCGLGFDRRFFLKIMLALQKTGFIRTDQPKLWGCGDFKELTRFMQSLFFFPILSRREVKRGSARRVERREEELKKWWCGTQIVGGNLEEIWPSVSNVLSNDDDLQCKGQVLRI